MAAAATRPVPALAPPPQPRRPRALFVGTAFAAAAVGMSFLGLIAIYISVRSEAIAGAAPGAERGHP